MSIKKNPCVVSMISLYTELVKAVYLSRWPPLTDRESIQVFEGSSADEKGSCCNAARMVKAYLTDVASFQCLAFDLSQFGR